MAKRKTQELTRGPGQPTLYRPEFCEMLMTHMKQGGSFESFAALAQCAKSSLYLWQNTHAEFSEAHKRGVALSLLFYEQVARMQMTGNLKRLKSEEPVLDSKGKPVLDPATGQVLMRREYEATTGSAAALIFMLKNLHGFRDRRDITVNDNPTPVNRAAELTPEERMKEIREMTDFIREVQEGGEKPVIDVTSKRA